MRGIKYYDNYDLSVGENFNMLLSTIDNIKKDNLNINDILEYFNILKFFNYEILNRVDVNIKNKCISSKSVCNNIISIIDDIEWYYIDNFFEIINDYKVYERISESVIFNLININNNFMFHILHVKNLVIYYDKCIRDSLINNIECAEWILDEYEVKHNFNHKKIYFPNSFKLEIFLN